MTQSTINFPDDEMHESQTPTESTLRSHSRDALTYSNLPKLELQAVIVSWLLVEERDCGEVRMIPAPGIPNNIEMVMHNVSQEDCLTILKKVLNISRGDGIVSMNQDLNRSFLLKRFLCSTVTRADLLEMILALPDHPPTLPIIEYCIKVVVKDGEELQMVERRADGKVVDTKWLPEACPREPWILISGDISYITGDGGEAYVTSNAGISLKMSELFGPYGSEAYVASSVESMLQTAKRSLEESAAAASSTACAASNEEVPWWKKDIVIEIEDSQDCDVSTAAPSSLETSPDDKKRRLE
jgi:hypothetical protein